MVDVPIECAASQPETPRYLAIAYGKNWSVEHAIPLAFNSGLLLMIRTHLDALH